MFKRLITILLVTLILSGCATVEESKKIQTNVENFFSTENIQNKGIIFFTCGTMTTKSWLGEFDVNLGSCYYKIDSVTYTIIREGAVAKLVLNPGYYQLEFGNEFDKNFTLEKVKLNTGDVLLATANHSALVGPVGGLIGGLSNQYIYNINIDREDIISKVVNKTPVLMTKSK